MTTRFTEDVLRYVRGEMPPQERAAFGQRLAQDPELRLQFRVVECLIELGPERIVGTSEHPADHDLADFACALATLLREDRECADRIAQHLESCEACRRAVSDMRDKTVFARYGWGWPRSHSAWLRPRFGLAHAVAAAAAVLVVVVSLALVRWNGSSGERIIARVDVPLTTDLATLISNYNESQVSRERMLSEIAQRLSAAAGHVVRVTDVKVSGRLPVAVTPTRRRSESPDSVRAIIYSDGRVVLEAGKGGGRESPR